MSIALILTLVVTYKLYYYVEQIFLSGAINALIMLKFCGCVFLNCYLCQSTQKIVERMLRFSIFGLVFESKINLVETFKSFEKFPLVSKTKKTIIRKMYFTQN